MAVKIYPSPSTLAKFAQCPRYVSTPFGNAAADEGVLLHDYMMRLAKLPVEEWDGALESFTDVTTQHLFLIREVMAQIMPFFLLGRPVLADNTDLELLAPDLAKKEFIAPECLVKPFPGRRGFIDLLVRDRIEHAHIIDYKFGRNDGDFTYQLSPYVLRVFEAFPDIQEVTGTIIAPRMDSDHDSDVWTRNDIPRMEGVINAIVEKMQDPFCPGTPGIACTQCLGNGRCVWQSQAVTALTVPDSTLISPLPRVPSARIVLQPTTPQERADRRVYINWLVALCDYVKADDKEVITNLIAGDVTSADVLPGFVVTMQRGKPTLDYERIGELNRSLMLTFSLGYETILSCLEPVWSKLVDTLTVPGAMPPNVDGSIPSRDDIEQALRSLRARYEIPGAPFPVVRKTGGRKAIGGSSSKPAMIP